MEKIRNLMNTKEPLKWVFSGDSITHGALQTFGARDYSELFSERIRYEMGRSCDIVIKSAISGTTTTCPLANFDTLIGQFNPHVVFLMFGMNDCSNHNVPPDKFSKNLKVLVDKICDIGGIPILQTTCPILPNSNPDREPYFDNYMDTIRDLASYKSAYLIDHNTFWKKNTDQLYLWMGNSFHPNKFGHLAFARLIFEELGIYDSNSNTCNIFFPGCFNLKK